MNKRLIHGDCTQVIPELVDKGIVVDAIITDPPYGTMKTLSIGTDYSWDDAIPIDTMLSISESILRKNGSLCLFSHGKKTAKMMLKNSYRHKYVYVKDSPGHVLSSKKAPVAMTEDVLIFRTSYDQADIHPLRKYFEKLHEFIGRGKNNIHLDLGHEGAEHCLRYDSIQFSLCTEKTYMELIDIYNIDSAPFFRVFDDLKKEDIEYKESNNVIFNLKHKEKCKSNILAFKHLQNDRGFHPTQKPVALMRDLIETYTNPGDTVLDFCMGSGSTGVAAIESGRNFIGIEQEEKYFDAAEKRMSQGVLDFSR